jgi:hypothetical protein
MDFCRCQRVREHKTRTRAIAATCLVSMLPIGVGGTTESSDALGGAAPNRSASILFFSVRSYSNSTAKSVTCSKDCTSVFLLIGAVIVVFARGFGDGFSWRKNGWKAQTTRRRSPNKARQIRRWR